MVEVHFIHADGEGRTVTNGSGDDSLLKLGQAIGMPLEGTCEGQMACSTCHVIIDSADFASLPQASEAEEDMLDLAAGACRTSRLACQILMRDIEGASLTVRIPAAVRNMQGL